MSQQDLMRHARDGWPKCCGQVMDYLISAAGRCPTCGRPGALTFPVAEPQGAPVRIVCFHCALGSDAETKS